MPELTNIHDRFFKAMFKRISTIVDFLANYLPEEIARRLDLSTAKIVEGSFIDKELRERFSDLLYRVELRGGGGAFVYVLFEHKSAPDKWVAFQLLRYMMRIWEQTTPERDGKLPAIFPIVLYHGKSKWRIDKRFTALIELKDIETLDRYLPNFEYHLCDLSSYHEDEIRGVATLRITLLALKYVFHPELRRKLPRIFGVLNQLLTTDMDALECLRIVMQYLARARGLTGEDFRPAIQHVFWGESERIMSNFFDDAIEQGLRQGRQEGLLEGRRQGAEDLTLRQLSRQIGSVGTRVEKRVRKLTPDQLERLGVDLLKFVAPKDLTAWLREHLGH